MRGGLNQRERLLALTGEVRAELHRYCARLTGSTFEGEDIVQDVLLRALVAVEELEEDRPLRPWLFRIAHNRAVDHLRSQAMRRNLPWETVEVDWESDPAGVATRRETVTLAVSYFLELPVAQRSAVILKDVLGHSLAEIAELLNLSVNAVKAALTRGRAKLQEIKPLPSGWDGRPSPQAARFANLFNGKDWDALRALLADEVHLSQTALAERRGRQDVSVFFTIYSSLSGLRLVPARLDGGRGPEVIAVFACGQVAHFMYIEWRGDSISYIRDFKYASYVLEGADLVSAAEGEF